MENEQYVPVDILPFREATRDIFFDVYLKLGEGNYAHVFSKNTGLDYKRLASYIQKGVTTLYVKEEDLIKYQEFISRKAENVFNDPSASKEQKIASLLNMTEQNMAEIFSNLQLDEETAQKTKKVVTGYVGLMAGDAKTLAMILKLVAHGEYLYYHSIAVSVFSLFIAKASGQFNKKMFELVGLGGFLHDIGLSKLPKEIVDTVDEHDPGKSLEMRSHPKLGLKMLERVNVIPDEVRHIIYQHHEEPGGKGYPNRLGTGVIYYPAKIVALADAFSAYISTRPFREAMTVPEAIKKIQEDRGKFDRDLVDLTSQLFLRKTGSKAA